MASFTFQGRSVHALASHEFQLGDVAFISHAFGIPGLVELEEGMGAMEATAIRAYLVACIKRGDPTVAADVPGVDEVAIVPLIEALNAERLERAAQREAEAEGGARPTRATRARSGSRG